MILALAEAIRAIGGAKDSGSSACQISRILHDLPRIPCVSLIKPSEEGNTDAEGELHQETQSQETSAFRIPLGLGSKCKGR